MRPLFEFDDIRFDLVSTGEADSALSRGLRVSGSTPPWSSIALASSAERFSGAFASLYGRSIKAAPGRSRRPEEIGAGIRRPRLSRYCALRRALHGSFAALALMTAGCERDSDALAEAHQRLALLDRFAEPGAALFVGSSSIERLDAGAVAGRAVNLGLGNERIAATGERLRGYRSLADATLLVLAIGANDVRDGRPPAQIAAAMTDIVALAPPATRLVISGLQHGRAPGPERRAAFAAVNSRYAEICARRARCRFVDLEHVLASDPACRSQTVYDPDGIHLNELGYACWARALRSAIGEGA